MEKTNKEEIKKLKAYIKLSKINLVYHIKQSEYHQEELKISQNYLDKLISPDSENHL